jgi:hypothetical protein
MPKCRQAFADALARLVFQKPLAELDRSERAELNFLRALDGDAADEEGMSSSPGTDGRKPAT